MDTRYVARRERKPEYLKKRLSWIRSKLVLALAQSWERYAKDSFVIVPPKRGNQTGLDVTLRGDGEPACAIRLEFGLLWF